MWHSVTVLWCNVNQALLHAGAAIALLPADRLHGLQNLFCRFHPGCQGCGSHCCACTTVDWCPSWHTAPSHTQAWAE